MTDNSEDEDHAKHPGGRPSKYDPAFAAQAEKLCKLGATDEDLADFFEVSIRTVIRWRSEHDEFCQATKVGKEKADDRVERSLYSRAVGYTYDAVKIMQYEGEAIITPYREHCPPDTGAAIFWLKNRRKDDWRDKQTVEHGVTGEVAELLRAIDGATRGLPNGR